MRYGWSHLLCPAFPRTISVPELPKEEPDLIYLCFPNNPTGAGISKENLQRFVDYARKIGAVILYDAAYEAYISDPDSLIAFMNAKGQGECAIELRSFSKNAGFTGVRLGYTVVPKDLKSSEDVNAQPICGQDAMAPNTTELLTSFREPAKPFIPRKERRS